MCPCTYDWPCTCLDPESTCDSLSDHYRNVHASWCSGRRALLHLHAPPSCTCACTSISMHLVHAPPSPSICILYVLCILHALAHAIFMHLNVPPCTTTHLHVSQHAPPCSPITSVSCATAPLNDIGQWFTLVPGVTHSIQGILIG